MIREEKQLLLQDLCARLPYGVKVLAISVYGLTVQVPIDGYCSSNNKFDIDLRWRTLDEFKPYLRPMSSMTEEEEIELKFYGFTRHGEDFDNYDMYGNDSFERYSHVVNCYKFLISRHFDINGLIPKGLALEAPKGMYN